MVPGQLTAFLFELAFALLFIVLGIVFWLGKGSWLIAGYNTSSKTEKSKYDERALCRFVAKLMFFYAAICVLLAVSTWLDSMAIHYCVIALFLIITFAAVIYANTGNRFKKK